MNDKEKYEDLVKRLAELNKDCLDRGWLSIASVIANNFPELSLPKEKKIERYEYINDKKCYYELMFLTDEQNLKLWHEDIETVRNAMLQILEYKRAIVTCEYTHMKCRTDRRPGGYPKTLTSVVTYPGKMTFNSLLGLIKRVMPEEDPEFKEYCEHFYHVEWPQQEKEWEEEYRQKLIKEYTEEHKKKPKGYDLSEIERKVRYRSLHAFGPPTLLPSLYAQIDSLTVTPLGDRVLHSKELDDYIEFLKNIDLTLPVQRLPNGIVKEVRNISFNDWMEEMHEKETV